MGKTAVTAILRSYGKWITTEPFIKIVSEKRAVKERQAYNLIIEAVRNKEILKNLLQDGKTKIYGLAEFGIPQFGPTLEVKPLVLVVEKDPKHKISDREIQDMIEFSKDMGHTSGIIKFKASINGKRDKKIE